MVSPAEGSSLEKDANNTNVMENGWKQCFPRVALVILLVFAVLAVASCSRSDSEDPPSAPGETPAGQTPATTGSPSPADTANVATLIAQADQFYNGREDMAKIREAIKTLQQARAADFESYDATWRLARCDYYLGANTEDNKERDKAFTDGIEAGREAVKLQGNKPEGHFWLGANLGGQAENSALSGLSDVGEIRREMETVIRLDESFQSGSAYMVLGQVDLETPKFLGGDPQRAVEQLEKGLKFGEKNSLLRLHLAEAYLAVKRPADARKQLNTILTMQPDPEYAPEHREAVAEAKKMLAQGLKGSTS